MKSPTITQNMSLFEAQRRENITRALRAYDLFLRGLRRAARKKRRQLRWLKLRRCFHSAFRIPKSAFKDPELRSFEMRRNG
jgi:hypothetical protein